MPAETHPRDEGPNPGTGAVTVALASLVRGASWEPVDSANLTKF